MISSALARSAAGGARSIEAGLVAVRVRGVEEVDAEVERPADDPLGFIREAPPKVALPMQI